MACDDIGILAFDRLLDRLVDETREAHVMRGRIGDLTAALKRVQDVVDNLESRLASMAERALQCEKGEGTRYALVVAAQDVLDLVTDKGARGRISCGSPEFARLRKAAKEAEPYCPNPIPF